MDYATTKSWASDSIYWKYLDERFFGVRDETGDACERWRTRVGILSPEEKEDMGSFVGRKMEEEKERNLVDWEPEEARERLTEVLRGCEEVGCRMGALNLT